LLRNFGEDIPVFAGVSRPLLQSVDMRLGAQFQWLEDDVWTKTEHAVDYLIRAARIDEEPGEPLTIVPIGPLTNIALAFAREPELIPRVRLIIMGVAFLKRNASGTSRATRGGGDGCRERRRCFVYRP
jgi:purine nucleosidase